MKKKKDIKKNKNQKKSLNKGRNNKNILHLFFLCFSIFILGLLLMEKYIYNEGIIEKILYNILQIFKLIFAKGLFTFLILSIVVNFIEIYKKKSRRNNFFRKVFFCLAFLSFLALLSLKDLGSVSSTNIFDAGQDLLSLAFEKKGGGLIGYITLIPFYSFLKSPHIYTCFFASTCIFTLFVIFKYIRLVYLMIYRTYSYYNSDDYEKKKKILQAKKRI